ncbi:MAG: hypothetical protein C0179_05070 [Fervidicoccus sp.]|nr:MAG: hypothetical protein C0179_05070 [Fervidicoccus sp.]
MSVFKEVSLEKFTEIREVISRFIESHNWKRVYHLKSLDEDEDLKRIIKLFEENSVIKGSVDSTTIYVIPIYFYVSNIGYGYALVASLIIERESSEYIVKIYYGISGIFKAPNRGEAEKLIDEWLGGFVKLLGKTISDKHPIATKLAEIAGCWRSIESISLLYRFYGDEILNDDTIPGLHSICHEEADLFVNDKVIVIPYIGYIGLFVVRDKDSSKIFANGENNFYEVPQDEKIFYEALFSGLNDLLKPEAVVKDKWGNKYPFSSTEVAVDGGRVVLVAFGHYDHKVEKWYMRDILAIAYNSSRRGRRQVYSFQSRRVSNTVSEAMKSFNEDLTEALLGFVFLNREIHKKAKEKIMKELTKKHEWKILPA